MCGTASLRFAPRSPDDLDGGGGGTNALSNEPDITKVQEWLGHANVSARLYERRRTRPEDSPIFHVKYEENSLSRDIHKHEQTGMSKSKLPSTVRYVKNGQGGRWWREAHKKGQVHLGWKSVPKKLLVAPDFTKIEKIIRGVFGPRRGATQDFNALKDLLDNPGQHLWITFEDGCMWWCTVRNEVTVNPDSEGSQKGHFWLTCDRQWSNSSLGGRLLAISDLPGVVTTTGGFKGTVCTPTAWEMAIRLITDEKDPDAELAAAARAAYKASVLSVIRKLPWKDFEQLIDLILARTGWARVSTIGSTQEGIDMEVENLTAAELAFVQVKSSAGQAVLDEYVEKFEKRRDHYARMIFAVHSPVGKITAPPANPSVQLWTGERIADLVVRLGLGEWIERKLG